MDTASLPTRGVADPKNDAWRSLEHHVLKRRTAAARGVRRRHSSVGEPVRDAFEIWRSRPRGVRFVARLVAVGLTALAAADVLFDAVPLHLAALVGAVLMAGTASLMAVAAADPDAANPVKARRWQLQAVASAVVMFMLMANGTGSAPGDLLWFLIVVGAASTLVAMATSYRDG